MSIYDPGRLTATDIEDLKTARREAGDMGIPDDVGEADPSWWHLDKAVRALIDKTIVTTDAQSQLSNYDRTLWHLEMAKDSHTVAEAHMHAACAMAHAALAQIEAAS